MSNIESKNHKTRDKEKRKSHRNYQPRTYLRCERRQMIRLHERCRRWDSRMKKASVEARIAGEVQVGAKKLRFDPSQLRDVLELSGKGKRYRSTYLTRRSRDRRRCFGHLRANRYNAINCSLQSGRGRATSLRPPATTASCADARACADADDGASRCADTPVDPNYQLRHFCPGTLRIGCRALA